MTSKSSLRSVPASAPKVAVALVAILALACVGCGAGGDGTPDGGGATVPPPTITMAVTIGAAGEGGRRDASVRVETTAPLADMQLDFSLPESCQRVAGAATRSIPTVLPGQPVSQGIGFQCPAEAKGSVGVKLTGKDAQGRAVDVSAEAAL